VTVREDEEYERAREKAEEAARTAEERARAEAERLKQDVLTGSMNLEVVRQQGLIYGGLILIGLYMVQPFPTAPSLDVSAKVSILAFSVAIPLLAALVVVQPAGGLPRPADPVRHGHRRAGGVAQGAAFVGIVAGFWHITWVAGVAFLATGFVAVWDPLGWLHAPGGDAGADVLGSRPRLG
jgi:hypothetical protein